MRERALSCILLFLLPFSLESVFGTAPSTSPQTTATGDSTRRPAQSYQLHATRIEQAPTVDGRLTEQIWKTADTATGFTQFKPNPGEPASFPTRVRVVYDESAIYIGARMVDHPDSVVARTARRDQSQTRRNARFDPVHDLGSVFAGGRNTFGVKLTYWLGL
jgi:energy-converting hydrogenase Eha subunit F